jgi:hypothetical protein
VAAADLVVLRGSRATISDLLGDAVADRDTDAIERPLIERVPGSPPFVAPGTFVAPETTGGRT